MSTIQSTDVPRKYSIANLPEQFTIICFIAIAWYNAIELIVLCFATFKKYGGFYFWALFISSISILPFGLGYILIIFDIFPGYFAVAVEEVDGAAWLLDSPSSSGPGYISSSAPARSCAAHWQ
jgi:hypothetical protein